MTNAPASAEVATVLVPKLRLYSLTPADTGLVTQFLAGSRDLVSRKTPPIDWAYVEQTYGNALAEGHSFAVVDEAQRAIAGVLILLECNWFWNPKETFLRNENFFVTPKYRASRAAIILIKAAKARARQIGKPLHMLINFDGNPRTDKFIERQGFQRLGGYFEMET